MLSHPVCKQVFNTVTGQRGAGETIYLMPLRQVRVALDDLQLKLSVSVIKLLARPQCLSAWILDFTAQAGGFAMIIKGDAFNRIAIGLQSDKTIHG